MNRNELIDNARGRVEDLRRLQELGLASFDGSFHPAGVHYPPITMYPPAREESMFSTYVNPEDGFFDVYVHIPFCPTKCTYCHYPVMKDSPAEKDTYLSALSREMDVYLRRLGLRRVRARSVLVGGGTPTYLSPRQLQTFLADFTERVDLDSCTQFNYDVDPLTLLGEEGAERLRILRSYGVDRLTIGVQSLDDSILKGMNRHHSAGEAIQAVERARAMGFVTNTEYIFGFPGQTMDNWITVLEKAVALDADEIQLYRLKITPYGDRDGTIQDMFGNAPLAFPGAEEAIAMKQAALLVLASNGYQETLRRVFSRDPAIFSHYADNQCCRLLDQIGFGLTAFSSLRDRFVLNTQHLPDYYAATEQGKLPVNRGLIRSKEDQLRWAFILPLKNREIRKRQYGLRTGIDVGTVFRSKIENLEKAGLVAETERVIRLTPLGGFFADEVCHSFYDPHYLPLPPEAYSPSDLNPYRDSSPF